MAPNKPAREVLSLIDHTILKPDASLAEIERICNEAKAYRFHCVCVNSCHVPYCTELLAGTGVKICSVIGFPLGAMSTAAKAFEAATAIKDGASEIDMVLNVGLLKSGRKSMVMQDIKAVLDVCENEVLKVIIETGLLTREEKIIACEVCKDLRVGFVKTSTGFGYGGATVEDVKLMRQILGPDMGIKASGGVRCLNTALEFIKAGANRLGTSSGVAIAEEGSSVIVEDGY